MIKIRFYWNLTMEIVLLLFALHFMVRGEYLEMLTAFILIEIRSIGYKIDKSGQ